jgi:hypothetical protein
MRLALLGSVWLGSSSLLDCEVSVESPIQIGLVSLNNRVHFHPERSSFLLSAEKRKMHRLQRSTRYILHWLKLSIPDFENCRRRHQNIAIPRMTAPLLLLKCRRCPPTCYSVHRQLDIAVSPTKPSALPAFHHLRLPHHGNHVRNLEPWHRHWYNVHSPEPTILVELPSLRPPVQVADQFLRVCEIKTPLQESACDAATLIIGVDGNAVEICRV